MEMNDEGGDCAWSGVSFSRKCYHIAMVTLPKALQGVLWSKDVQNLDPRNDKNYIIHQILSYGNMEHFAWLFKTYPKREIIRVFTNHPYKDYTNSRFYFVKNFLLNVKNTPLSPNLYVKNTPRDIR